jgi:hypothetical protein
VVGCKYTNHRFSLRILQPEKRTLHQTVQYYLGVGLINPLGSEA